VNIILEFNLKKNSESQYSNPYHSAIIKLENCIDFKSFKILKDPNNEFRDSKDEFVRKVKSNLHADVLEKSSFLPSDVLAKNITHNRKFLANSLYKLIL
jgi:hypothetical protein